MNWMGTFIGGKKEKKNTLKLIALDLKYAKWVYVWNEIR